MYIWVRFPRFVIEGWLEMYNYTFKYEIYPPEWLVSLNKKMFHSGYRREKRNWKIENEELGLKLGYPACCVKEFCEQPPELIKAKRKNISDEIRYKASFLNGEYTGFIPCYHHAREIVSDEITLQSLIKNRDSRFSEFPADILIDKSFFSKS